MSRLRVAVIGAAGRVGSALVRSLGASDDFEVVAIVRNDLGAKTLGPVNAEVRVGSVADAESSRGLLTGCDAAINCALPKGWPRSARQISDSILRNIASAPSMRIAVHFSTVAVYGSCVAPRDNSFDRPHATSPYGVEKLRSERIAAGLFSARGIRSYIVRLGHVYGPYQQMTSHVLSYISDPSFTLPFGGDIPSNTVSIHGVVHALQGMLKDAQPTGVGNLVDNPQSSWREVFDYHTGLLGRAATASLSDAESEILQSRYFAEARAPIRTVLRAAHAIIGSADLNRLAQHIALRRMLHGPLSWAPSWIENAARHAYIERKVSTAVRKLASREPAPSFMCAPPVPGPMFNTIHKRDAAAAMADEMRSCLHAMTSYRWNAAELAIDPRMPRLESRIDVSEPQREYSARKV